MEKNNQAYLCIATRLTFPVEWCFADVNANSCFRVTHHELHKGNYPSQLLLNAYAVMISFCN